MQGLSLPAAQTIPNYALLAVVYGALQLLQRQKPQNGLGGYTAVAFLDVEANYLVVSGWCSFPNALVLSIFGPRTFSYSLRGSALASKSSSSQSSL